MSAEYDYRQNSAESWLALVSAAGGVDAALTIVAPLRLEASVDEIEQFELSGLYSRCAEICEQYLSDQYFYRRWKAISLREHKSKLESVVAAAKKLRIALSESAILVPLVMSGRWGAAGLSGKDFDPHLVNDVIAKLEREATALLESPDALSVIRYGVDRKWEPERALIWEPYFELVQERQGKIPVSRTGPVMRGIIALHSAIARKGEVDISEPSAETVYTAMQDFNSRIAATG